MPQVANETGWRGYPEVRLATLALYVGLILGELYLRPTSRIPNPVLRDSVVPRRSLMCSLLLSRGHVLGNELVSPFVRLFFVFRNNVFSVIMRFRVHRRLIQIDTVISSVAGSRGTQR